MGKQMKAKKPENFGKGKVTPVQVAFIVDRYLSDNNYNHTHSVFRTEASTLISRTQLREAPKSLLSLGTILDEYICLKEQKVMLDREMSRMEQEKRRVETLLRGMQDVMHAYNSTRNISPPLMSATETKLVPLIPQSDPSFGSPAGVYPMYKTPITNSATRLSKTFINPTNLLTPMTNSPSKNKRKGPRLVPVAPPTAKRSCSQIPIKLSEIGGTNTLSEQNNTTNVQETIQQFSEIQSSPNNRKPNDPLVQALQGSTVAKSLFKQPSLSPPTNTPVPKTPPQAFPSQIDESVSPLESSSLVNSNKNVTPQEITPINCPIMSSRTVTVSPFKQVAYFTMERNHYFYSTSPVKTNLKRLGKRDHVKGRLDFDGSDEAMSPEKSMTAEISTFGPNSEAESFGLDMPNFDVLGADFSLSELLIDIDGEGIAFPCQSALDTSDFISGSPHVSRDGNSVDNQGFSELSSTLNSLRQT
ncbi:hypothetical protein HHK36_016275 [Tetracentron sinense]|uniref:Uncharacterized protein n=1 Tax=Tetracentron sinense TaxID=13715 RepID=A0A834Z013_TETSI|nr:hypothetical protein HHK36_016275 [Tetracentron sinense]